MRYKLLQLELSRPLEATRLAVDENGVGIVARWHDRPIGFRMVACRSGQTLTPAALTRIADTHFASAVLEARVGEVLPASLPGASPKPSLSIVICTKDRAKRLTRLLATLRGMEPDPTFRSVEIVVVDNGSADSATRDAVAGFDGVRYVHEARTGLNFARNAALAAATGELIAYLDDDVVVDRWWLCGLAEAWRSRPDAGGFSGLVLPFRLDTEAQRLFEARGGFGRGFRRIEHRRECYDNPLFPTGAGSVGAGCNMAFDRLLLITLGGFDEALDTGAPLPGGGDLDIFYRVLRSGRPMVYEPRYAVFHEHRETIPQLRRQYWSWGLGLTVFLTKSRRSDPAAAKFHKAMIRWWFGDQLKFLAKAIRVGDLQQISFGLAELRGGVQGMFGEYRRSQARVKAIREAAR